MATLVGARKEKGKKIIFFFSFITQPQLKVPSPLSLPPPGKANVKGFLHEEEEEEEEEEEVEEEEEEEEEVE